MTYHIIPPFRPGSVIANFTIYYNGFDSYQFVLLQDVIDVDKSIGKLDLMPYPTSFQLGPNGEIRCFCSESQDFTPHKTSAGLATQIMQINHCSGEYSNY